VLDSLWRDVRFGQRLLRKDGVVSLAAIVSLGLAIGACAAAFSCRCTIQTRSCIAIETTWSRTVKRISKRALIWEQSGNNSPQRPGKTEE
jgi:hypothetical protein